MATRRRKRHAPEQIVRKFRDADAMLNAGKDQAAVLKISGATYLRWGTRPRSSLRPALLLPRGLRPRSSSTAKFT